MILLLIVSIFRLLKLLTISIKNIVECIGGLDLAGDG